jgi:hypothetical protein
MSLHRIFNQGEIASLAHGWRSVIALDPGRKWITIVDFATLETARLPLDLWQRLQPQPATGYSRRRVRAAIAARLRYVEKTKAISAAAASLSRKGPAERRGRE